ncbi:MAG: hypothetical protein U0835_18410 [Isosphaeraceae bacterium]
MRLATQRLLLASVTFFGVAGSAAHAQVVISDGTFAAGDWVSARYGPAGTSTVTVFNSGGNPGDYVNISGQSVNNGDVLFITYIKQSYTNTNALSGQNFTMSIDRAAIGSDGFPATGFAIQQGSSVWYYNGTELPTRTQTTWATGTETGTFNPSFFVLLTGSGLPNFSAGVSTKIGFYAHLQNPAGVHGMSYDNWSLSSTALSVIPEPSPLALLGVVGLGGAVACRVARRRRPVAAA